MTNDMHEAGYGHKTFVYVGAPLPILKHFNHKAVNLNIFQPVTLQCPSNISDICLTQDSLLPPTIGDIH